MPAPSSTSPQPSAQTREVARSGAFALMGSLTSALMGFLLIAVLGRVLGPNGAGVLLQAIAAFTIALAVTRAGLDTAAVWLLPRIFLEEPGRVRAALLWLLVPCAATGLLGGLGLGWVGAALPAQDPRLNDAILVMAVCLPFATIMTVGLAATRGLGGVRPYVVIGSMAVPAARPFLVLLASAVTAGSLGAAVAWVAPLPVAALATLIVLTRAVHRLERLHPRTSSPQVPLGRRVYRYALPRSVSTVLEQSMQWLDVILVGALAGSTAAGVYGAASRLVAAGLILSTALRIVVAPLYSRSLGAGRPDEVRALYSSTTTWLIFFSTPVFLIFAAYGGTVLALLGPGFRSGAPTLLILSVGLLTVLLAGNVQSVLLMSGRSTLAAVNKTVALAATLVGIMLLVPRWGIEGAATAWAFGMVLDSGLALWQVSFLVGVRLELRRVLFALVVSMTSVGLPLLALRMTLGDEPAALALSLVLGAVFLAATGMLFRRRLCLDDILQLVKARRVS